MLFACLQCIFIGCKGYHFLRHFETSSHFLGLELTNSLLYCHHCKDYVYDEQCSDMARHQQIKGAR